jgi:serine/threonine protein kinase
MNASPSQTNHPLWSLFSWFAGSGDAADAPDGIIRSPRHVYTLRQCVAAGDVADVFFATHGDEMFLLKIAVAPEGRPFLEQETRALSRLATAAGKLTYGRYLPELVESFSTGSPAKRVNVFRAEPGLTTLEQVHEQHPVLEARHIAWIFKRLLAVLGFSHRHGIIHGAVLPGHVLIHAGNHGLRLVGWGHSVEKGQRLRSVSEAYATWYPTEFWKKLAVGPATDLFLAARCMVYLAGGDPLGQTMPDQVPSAMQRFLRSCLLESPGMRPDDAWALHEEFDQLLLQLYGPPKFHELKLT